MQASIVTCAIRTIEKRKKVAVLLTSVNPRTFPLPMPARSRYAVLMFHLYHSIAHRLMRTPVGVRGWWLIQTLYVLITHCYLTAQRQIVWRYAMFRLQIHGCCNSAMGHFHFPQRFGSLEVPFGFLLDVLLLTLRVFICTVMPFILNFRCIYGQWTSNRYKECGTDG